jgi:hypothetical protein
MIVYYVGNSAEWIKARGNGIIDPIIDSSDTGLIPTGTTIIKAESADDDT